ncbi:hypothetical protein OG689_44500 [Kitasatospora sp. NBC_00240]|uniref:hypothetical protein n=1 Tax=Kitasatospora sp. NBC_00240 TaxID=2903567 RepID=UPI00225BC012|nr:hypothetical protein [Kitasatospora sp. NBC_00240]MCX5216200.1 hypothetical protein [Kitasatospora sp. NBC_00240]
MSTNDVIDGLISNAGNVPEYAKAVLDWALANVWWVALLAVGTASFVGGIRRLMSRSTLRDRQAFELLPTNGFDPGIEDVLRFAKQLARAQRSTSRWTMLPARGSAVRIRLLSVGGPMSLRVEGPARAVAVLRHQGYAQCELRSVTEDAGPSERPTIRLGPRLDDSDSAASLQPLPDPLRSKES